MVMERKEFQQRMSEIKQSLEGMNPREIDIDMYVYAGAVKLKRDPGYYADPRWGVPSCERRISS